MTPFTLFLPLTHHTTIGISKEVLADQLFEVCETMKGEETGLVAQGLESLQKALHAPP